MSDILDTINNKIAEYTKYRDYVLELKNRVEELEKENTNTFQNISFYEVQNKNPETIAKLYMPKTRFVTQKKCDKCDKYGLIKVEDNFFNAYTLCRCQYSEIMFEPYELDVFQINEYEDCVFYHVYDGTDISINGSFIKDCFEKDDLQLSTVYYKNLEDCEELCKYLNKEIAL